MTKSIILIPKDDVVTYWYGEITGNQLRWSELGKPEFCQSLFTLRNETEDVSTVDLPRLLESWHVYEFDKYLTYELVLSDYPEVLL
jgi:hypothetical protein